MPLHVPLVPSRPQTAACSAAGRQQGRPCCHRFQGQQGANGCRPALQMAWPTRTGFGQTWSKKCKLHPTKLPSASTKQTSLSAKRKQQTTTRNDCSRTAPPSTITGKQHRNIVPAAGSTMIAWAWGWGWQAGAKDPAQRNPHPSSGCLRMHNRQQGKITRAIPGNI